MIVWNFAASKVDNFKFQFFLNCKDINSDFRSHRHSRQLPLIIRRRQSESDLAQKAGCQIGGFREDFHYLRTDVQQTSKLIDFIIFAINRFFKVKKMWFFSSTHNYWMLYRWSGRLFLGFALIYASYKRTERFSNPSNCSKLVGYLFFTSRKNHDEYIFKI